MDQVNFLEDSDTYTNYGGSASGAVSKLMVNSEAEFNHDDSTFSLFIPSISSTDRVSSIDLLTLRIAVANETGRTMKLLMKMSLSLMTKTATPLLRRREL